MMKMLVRPQRTQLSDLVYAYRGTFGVFYKAKYIQAGYRNYDLMIVGAIGGKSGRAGAGSGVNGGRGWAYPSGGGGGGSIRKFGPLSELASTLTYSVGSPGSPGANVALNTKAPNGGAGGATTFGDLVAPGGTGGVGGRINSNGTFTVGSGGTGGAGPGATGGVGSGSDGNWVGNASGGSGGGGGGGLGMMDFGPSGDGPDGSAPVPGAEGSVDMSEDYLADPGPAPSGTMGGTGGGVNVQQIVGVENLFGTGEQLYYNQGGLFIIKLS